MNIRTASWSLLLALVALLLAPAFGLASGAKNKPSRPNVLFISIDDLNDWIGCLGGHPQARTPNIDKLAKQSVLFTRAYCSAPACNPSRASLMTGVAPHRSGLYRNNQVWREALPDAVTIPQYFARFSYIAFGGGKIFHNNMPDPQSWTAYFPSKIRHMPGNFYPRKRPVTMPFKKGHYIDFDWGPIPKKDQETGDYRTVSWVIGQLKKKYPRPFFLACGIYRPHVPWFVPPKYFGMFPEKKIQLPKTLKNDLDDIPAKGKRTAYGGYHRIIVKNKLWKSAVRGYLASIAYADAQVGRLLAALARSPHRDNTIVILWSDHGWMLGEKTHWRKFALWDQSCRVPLIVSVPPGTPGLPKGNSSGVRCDRVVSLMDLYPTLTDLCGLPQRKDIDGRSLVPLLANPRKSWDHPALTHNFDRGDYAITTGRWRYIRYNTNEEELYDLQKDPREWHNLAGAKKYAKIKAGMRALAPKLAPLAKTDYKKHLKWYRKARKEDWQKSLKKTGS